MRFLRFLPLVVAALLGAWALSGGLSGGAEREVAARAAKRDSDLGRFREALVRWRAGEEGARVELATLADELARAGRTDARSVLSHYERLAPEERRAGLDLERRYESIWIRVDGLRHEGLSIDEWRDERAEVLHELDQVIDEARAAADVVPLARCLGLRARLHVERAESNHGLRPDELQKLLDAARDDARESASLFESAGMTTPRLEPLWVEARVEREAQREERAESAAEQCLTLARVVGNVDFERHALELQLELAHDAGDLDRMERVLRDLGPLTEAIAHDWTIVRRQADLFVAHDRHERALELLEKSPPEAPEHRFEWRQRLSSVLQRANRLDEAAAGLERIEGGTANEMALTRAAIALARGAHEAAFAAANEVLASDTTEPDELRDATWIAGESALALGRLEDAVRWLEVRLGDEEWLEARGMRRFAGTEVTSNRIGERGGLHGVVLLADAYLRAGRPLDAAAAIERSQSRSLRGAPSDGPSAKLESADLTAWAARFEAGLVTWVVGADSSVVVAVGANGVARGARIARGRRSIVDAARRLREAVIGGNEERADELARAIQDELLPASIAGAIDRTEGRLLCLVHGPIERLALERLPLFANGALAPACLPGLPTRRPPAEPARTDALEWTLAGAPVDVGGNELLPGARAELEALARLHPTAQRAFGREFTRAELMDALHSTRALHVATHLVRDEHGASGALAPIGLELSTNDALLARDVAALAPRVPFAFLSACETGEGTFVDAHGLLGLARVLLQSGTRNLLVTLWPVQDEAARDFALAFHQELARGAAPSLAAAAARAALRSNGWPAAEWAAFRALGAD